jgi:hypothetical protein
MSKVKKKKSGKSEKSALPPPLKLAPSPTPVLPILCSPQPKTQALLFTAVSGEVNSLTRMIGHYDCLGSLASVDLNGSTALHLAVRKDNVEIVRKLLGYPNTPLNAFENTNVGGHAALHIACSNNSIEIVKILVDAGADLNLLSKSALGESPLHVCCKHGCTGAARILLAAGAIADVRDSFGHNPSYWASYKLHGQMIRELGLPPTHKATAQDHYDMMRLKHPGFSLAPKVVPKKKDKGKGKGKKK